MTKLLICTFIISSIYGSTFEYFKGLYRSGDSEYVQKAFISDKLTLKEKVNFLAYLQEKNELDEKSAEVILYFIPQLLKDHPNDKELVDKLFNSVLYKVNLEKRRFYGFAPACYFINYPVKLSELVYLGMEVDVTCRGKKIMEIYRKKDPSLFEKFADIIESKNSSKICKIKRPLSNEREVMTLSCSMSNIVHEIDRYLIDIQKKGVSEGANIAFKAKGHRSRCSAIALFKYSKNKGFVAEEEISFKNVLNSEIRLKGKSIEEIKLYDF